VKALTVARHLTSLGAILLLLGSLNACGGGSGPVVARVGSAGIANATLNHWVSVIAGGGVAGDPPGPGHQGLQARALAFLISSQRLLGEAGEAGVEASDEEAQHQLDLVAYDKQEGIPYEGLPPQGELPVLFARARSHSDKLWLMKLAILTLKVKAKQTANAERQITGTQIASYYQAHKSSFVLPERRDLQWIVTYNKSTLQHAVQEIRAGKDFVAVAKHVSLDPPTISGMELATEREKDFARHVFAARPHVIVGPFRQVQNYYMLEVTKVTPARQQTLSQSEATIRRRLAAQWVATSLRQALQARWLARTKCSRGYVVAGCSQHRAA
jgi:foldase protein PrsA